MMKKHFTVRLMALMLAALMMGAAFFCLLADTANRTD